MKKKVLALVLCLAMVLSVLPMSAFAAENEGITYVDRSWDGEKVVETEKECEDFIVVDENTTAFDDGKWYVVKNSVTVNERIAVNGTANLILCDGYTLTVPFGIENATGDTLNIYGQNNDSGVLSITKSKQYKPAIGASEGDSITGNVNIYGGTVAATGGSYAAGIGSGTYAGKDSGNVAVFGGSVTAKSKSDGAGIGGGHLRNGGTLTVYGGTVNATGGSSGAGIGGGNKGCGGTVTVYGGTVNATGGVYAAGIGSGNGEVSDTEPARNGGSVCVYGGTVTAKGKDGGAGIGGGFYAEGADVYIGGGSVTASSTKSRAIGGGKNCGSHGTLTVPVIMALKAGDAEPGTGMTVEEYEQTGYKYANIYENFIAKGENWYIDKEFVLHLTGAVTNTSTTIDNTPWKEYKTDIVAVVAEDGAKVTNCDRLFSNCTNLKSVDIAKLDITGTTTMRYMFSGCPSLESLDLSTLDTSAVTSMMCMFYNASGLKSINVSGWHTSNVNDMQYMFNNCASLTELDLGSFDTSKVTTVYTMFYNCSKLEKLNIGNFSGDNLTSTDFVLSSCPALTEITVNGNALQKLAEPIISAGIVPVWYNNVTTEKYQTTDDLKAIEGKVTLVKSVPFLFNSASLVLSGELVMDINCTVNDMEAVKDGYMEMTVGSTSTQKVSLSDAAHNADGTYSFPCCLNVLQMADDITLSFHYGDTVVGPYTKSVAQYLNNIKSKYGDNAELIALAEAIADYGHFAQPALQEANGFEDGKYQTMNRISEEAFALPDAADLASYKATKTGSVAQITNVSRALALDHGTDILLYLTCSDGYTPSITVTDKDGNPVACTLSPNASGKFTLTIPQISAHKLGDFYTVRIDNGAMEIEISALSYAYSVLKSATASDAQKEAVAALYYYYQAAIAYQTAKN